MTIRHNNQMADAYPLDSWRRCVVVLVADSNLQGNVLKSYHPSMVDFWEVTHEFLFRHPELYAECRRVYGLV